MSHPPKDGETFDTICTAVGGGGKAVCEGNGLVAEADNNDAFFKVGNRYVWYVRTAPAVDPTGDAGETQSGD